jgi:uncharacterized membrane protein
MSEKARQTQSQVDAVMKPEEEALQRRSSSERFADGVGLFAGSLPFVLFHLVLLLVWVLVNVKRVQ